MKKLFGALILLPFAAAIVWLHDAKGVPLDTFIFGSGSWGIGCILKLVLYHGLVRKLRHTSDNILRVSVLNGAVSGITELGVALVVFMFMPRLSMWDVVAFGVGIGTIEAFLVATPSSPLKGTGLEGPAAELEAVIAGLPKGPRFVYSYVVPLIERLIATGIHIGTRGMVYVAYRSAKPLPFVIALLVFVFADGIVGYRLLHQGRLKDLRVLNRTCAVLLLLAVISIVALVLFWPACSHTPAGPNS